MQIGAAKNGQKGNFVNRGEKIGKGPPVWESCRTEPPFGGWEGGM